MEDDEEEERACFPRDATRRFSLSFKSRRSNHRARKIIRVGSLGRAAPGSRSRSRLEFREKEGEEKRKEREGKNRELKSSSKSSGCDHEGKFRGRVSPSAGFFYLAGYYERRPFSPRFAKLITT